MDGNLGGNTNPLSQNAGTVPTGEPMRPMQQAPVQDTTTQGKKQKHTGRTIGIIIGVLVLIGVGVGVACALLLKNDPVSKAVEKIANGEMPEYAAIDGTIEFTPTDTESSLVSSIKIDLDSQLSTKTLMNSSSADVTIAFDELGEISFTASELYPSNGDLYFKIDNFKTSLDEYANALETVGEISETILGENAVTTTVEETMTSAAEPLVVASNAAEQLDGQWLMLSLSDINTLFTEIFQMSNTSCVTSLTGDLKNSTNQIAQLYNDNAFVSSTTDEVSLTSKNSQVYKVVFDNEKFNNFTKQLDSSSAITNFNNCTGSTFSMTDEVKNEGAPLIYVEVDSDYNFTRFYTKKNYSTIGMDMVADLDLTYPSNINVATPEEYTNLIESLDDALEGLVDGATDDVEEIVTEVNQ